MTLHVTSLCAYYPQNMHEQQGRTQSLWHSYKFCKAVKTKTINGTCDIPTGSGSVFTISQANVMRARTTFGNFVLQQSERHNYTDCVYVPVPSKDSFTTADFRSLVMLRDAFAGKAPGTIVPMLQYTSEQQPHHQGGRRDFKSSYDNIAVAGQAPTKRVVLVDDIATSGNSLLACQKRLQEAGYDVLGAIVCGNTIYEIGPGFRLHDYELQHEPDLWAGF